MRILLVSCAYAPLHRGGVATLLRRIARDLRSRGHNVAVFTADHPVRERNRPEPDADITLFTVETPNPTFNDRYREADYRNPGTHEPFRRAVESFKPDVIHFHAIQGLGAGLIDLVPAGTMSVLTMHDYWWACANLFFAHLDDTLCTLRAPDAAACSACLAPMASETDAPDTSLPVISARQEYLHGQLSKFDHVLAVSQDLHDRIKTLLPGIAIAVCENGVMPPTAPKNKPEPATRADRHTNAATTTGNRPLVFGFTGGLHHVKGFNCMMEALAHLTRRDFRLHIHSVPLSARQRVMHARPQLRRIIRTLAGRKTVAGHPFGDPRVRLFPPYRDDASLAVYRSFDVLLAPSIVYESFSLVCREAMLCGLPVIASRCGGPESLVRDGHNGLLVNPNDPDQLRAAMNRCIDEPALVRHLRDGARQVRIRSTSEMIDQLLDIYGAAPRSNSARSNLGAS